MLYPAANRQGVLQHELHLLRRERELVSVPRRRTAWLGERLRGTPVTATADP